MSARPTRRAFLRDAVALPAMLVLAGRLPLATAAATTTTATTRPSADVLTVAYFLKIAGDGTVILQLSRHEMGQGVATALAAILADELGAAWLRVRVEFMDYDKRYRYATGGSSTIASLYEPLRKIGALARERLIEAAAKRLGVPVERCVAVDGQVVDQSSGKRLGFGELAPLVPPPVLDSYRAFLGEAKPALKPAHALRLIGRPQLNLATADIVRGRHRYASDVSVPGMLHAVVARCPVYRGRLVRYDDRAALKIPGVRKVVRVEPYVPHVDPKKGDWTEETNWCVHEGVAVLADSTWAAMRGREVLVVEWDDGENAGRSNADWRAFMAGQAQRPARPVHAQGRREAMAEAATRVSAVYEYPFQAHAPMETMNCLAHVRADDTCELWIGTQSPEYIVQAARQALGIAAAGMNIHPHPSGGSFGRRFYPDVAVEAMRISRAAGNLPVKLLWTREDDMRHDHFHFDSYDRYEGGFDAERNLVALRLLETCSGFVKGQASWNPYDIANKHHDSIGTGADAPLKTGAWRSVTNNAWGFGQECFMDELAHHAGVDPLAFRLRHLAGPQAIDHWGTVHRSDPARLRNVLTLAARHAGWGEARPAGRALGIAAYDYLVCNAWCAHVAEVSVEAGRLIVHRVVCVLDCGLVVNPDGVRAQVEGNVVWGLSALLKGNLVIDKGRVTNSNFHDFPVLRISECPVIDVHLAEGKGEGDKPGGVGETSLPSVIPAVLNAVFAATGKRIRRLPLNADDLT